MMETVRAMRDGYWQGYIVRDGLRRTVDIYVSGRPGEVVLRTDAYDGEHTYPWAGGADFRGFSEEEYARRELERLQRLADAGKPLWSE
jgi:hypothetical protein